MSFTDQRRFVVTATDVARKWGLDGQGFRCGLCGHRFAEGDGVRWVYGNNRNFSTDEGHTHAVCNFMTCDACDGPDVLDRWVDLNREFYSARFWSFR